MALVSDLNRNNPEYWVGAVRDSETYRNEYARKYDWGKLRRIWNTGAMHTVIETMTNQQNPGPGFKGTFVNWIWAFCQTFVPAVYWRQPKIRVNPREPQYAAGAPMVESVTNAQIQRSKFRRECLKSVSDALVYGHGWTKLGWFTKPGQVPADSRVPEPYQKEGTMDADFNMSLGEGYMVRISPENMFVDNYATCFEEMRWLCQQYYVPYDAFKNDPYMRNKSHATSVDLTSEGDGGTDIGMPITNDANRNTNNERWIRIWEIWDRLDRKVRFLASGCDKWNRVVPWPYPDIHGFPFKPLTFTDGINQFYPVSVVLPWLPLVEELSTLRTIRMRHLMKMIPKVLLPQGLLDEEQLKKFGDPDVEFMECTGDASQQTPYVFPGLRPDANLYASEDQIKSDIRDISGFSELLSGQVPYSRIAATTSAIMEKNATVRFDYYSERLADHIIDCGHDMFLIARRMMTYPQLVEITGDEGPQMLQISANALRGDYQFEMDLEDMSVSSRQQRVKESFDALQVLAGIPGVKLHPLVRDFLSAHGKHDMDQYMDPPQGPPLDPNYENEMLRQGVPVDPNPLEDFELHFRVHTNFMQSPQFQAVQQVPALVGLFSEHLQKTQALSRAVAMQEQTMGRRNGQGQGQGPGQAQNVMPGASQQQGGALAGSQPVGGQQRMQ